MSKKKINPRRRPATQADINRAKNEATNEAVTAAMAIFLSVLTDKEGYDKSGIQRVWRRVNERSDAVAQGYASIADYQRTLEDEYDILI